MTPNNFARHTVSRLLSLILILGFCTPTFAWSDKGHQIIGALAWLKLSDSAKEHVRELLPEAMSDPNGPLAAIASWADRRELSNPAERKWHYVDIPLWAETYDEKRDCAYGNCLVMKLEEKKNIFESSSDQRARAEALKYVVHFVADIHQPLHCAQDDKAGNASAVRFLGQSSNLHRVWDSDMIEASKLSVSEYAQRLRSVHPNKEFWVKDWANESHAIAKRFVYAIPKDRELGGDYYRRNLPILDKQLATAAQRLTEIIEKVSQNRPTKTKLNKRRPVKS